MNSLIISLILSITGVLISSLSILNIKSIKKNIRKEVSLNSIVASELQESVTEIAHLKHPISTLDLDDTRNLLDTLDLEYSLRYGMLQKFDVVFSERLIKDREYRNWNISSLPSVINFVVLLDLCYSHVDEMNEFIQNEVREEFNEIVIRTLDEFDGEVMKFIHDGAILLFNSSTSAQKSIKGIRSFLNSKEIMINAIMARLDDNTSETLLKVKMLENKLEPNQIVQLDVDEEDKESLESLHVTVSYSDIE